MNIINRSHKIIALVNWLKTVDNKNQSTIGKVAS